MNENIFLEENKIDILELIDKVLELYKRNNLEELEIKMKGIELRISSKQDISNDLLKMLNNQLLNTKELLKSDLIQTKQALKIPELLEDELNGNNDLIKKDEDNDLTKYSKIIRAPLSGNFYINVGGNELLSLNKNVKKGDVVCVIEAMKVMNEVNSEYDGIVKKIIPNNGDFVKESDPLIILE